jgi:hypothetical protein
MNVNQNQRLTLNTTLFLTRCIDLEIIESYVEAKRDHIERDNHLWIVFPPSTYY